MLKYFCQSRDHDDPMCKPVPGKTVMSAHTTTIILAAGPVTLDVSMGLGLMENQLMRLAQAIAGSGAVLRCTANHPSILGKIFSGVMDSEALEASLKPPPLQIFKLREDTVRQNRWLQGHQVTWVMPGDTPALDFQQKLVHEADALFLMGGLPEKNCNRPDRDNLAAIYRAFRQAKPTGPVLCFMELKGLTAFIAQSWGNDANLIKSRAQTLESFRAVVQEVRKRV